MNKYDDKILKIKGTEKELLELVKDKLIKENGLFNCNTKNIIEVLKRDSQMVKKFEAVVKAQQLIAEYTEKIKNSTNVDEIIELRKELNKCINKVKKEMINRGFNEIQIESYCEDIKNYRKTISEKLRYLKRENKISEIEYLNNKEDLTEEELIRLKKLVKNELLYGKRNLNKINKVKVNPPIKEKEIKKETESVNSFLRKPEQRRHSRYIRDMDIVVDEKNPTKSKLAPTRKKIGKYFVDESNIEDDKTTLNSQYGKYFVESSSNGDREKDLTTKKDKKNNSSIKSSGTISVKTYGNVDEYLSEKIDLYNEKYDVIIPEGYTESKIKNLRIFARNLPTIIRNKGRIKLMMQDSIRFNNRLCDLVGFIEYNREENSIINRFKRAITRTPFIAQEEFYNVEHQKCIDWIINYCKENNMVIK